MLGIAIIMLIIINNYFSLTSSQEYDEHWYNSSWHYRIKITVNTSDYNRTDWPIEVPLNFTDLLEQINISGTFDENSTRVYEVNGSGDILYEMTSQFDKALVYNAQNNAVGEVVFLLNGTVPKETAKTFYIYYDIEENIKKVYPSYSSELNISWDNEEAIINTSNWIFYLDTERDENTSGLYKLEYWQDLSSTYQNLLTPSGAGEKTREFIELTNGSDNFTYDLRQNGTVIDGPVRITFRQEGDETYWNDPDNETGLSHLLKEYRFYYNQNHSWIITNITNTGASDIYRNSTKASAVAFDTKNAFGGDYNVYINSTEPSWTRGTQLAAGAGGLGFLNYNQTGTDNFNASTTDSGVGRIGINLENTTIPSGSAITHTSAMIIHPSNDTADFWEEYKNFLLFPVNITFGEPERYYVRFNVTTHRNNYTWPAEIYNWNESVIVMANITFDPWRLNSTVNATFDNGTATTADDVTIVLYDDGTNQDATAYDSNFTGYFNISNTSSLGLWNISITLFNSDGYVLNESYINVTVLNQYNVDNIVDNPTGLGERNVTTTVKVWNYMNDTGMAGAYINCTYYGQQVDPYTNVSDFGNGTYLVWFNAPLDYGTYTVNCSAYRDGNTGYDWDEFTVESATTELEINHSVRLYNATNVGYADNETFELIINITNMGNSSAYAANFTLTTSPEIESNDTFIDCSNILINRYCTFALNITVLNNTVPGYYYVNSTSEWRNFIGSSGFNNSVINTTINVTSNPILDVVQTFVQQPVPPGNETTVTNLTIRSMGNVQLDTINFQVLGYDVNFTFEFTPPSLATLTNGQIYSVELNLTLDPYTSPGIYNGTINVTTANDGYEEIPLELIVTGVNVSINATPDEFTSNNITRYIDESFDVYLNATNLGNTTAFYSYTNISLPSGWSSNITNISCGNMTNGSVCDGTFNVTIPNLTAPGYYDVNYTVQWEDIGIGLITNTTTVNVTVVQNVTMEIPTNDITDTVQHNTVNRTIGDFTIYSTGNDNVTNIIYNLTGFGNFNMLLNTTDNLNLTAGSDLTVIINVTVPAGYPPGTYNASLNVTTNSTVYKEVNLSVIIPTNVSWYMNETYCMKSQQPAEGKACEILLSNLGNVNITFNVTPGSNDYSNHSNYTWVDSVNFTVPNWSSRVLIVYYNVTGVQGQDDYPQNYTINATHPSAIPDETNLTIELNRYIPAIVTVFTSSNQTQQTGSMSFGAEVDSLSGATITAVIANITQPDGTYETENMVNLGDVGSKSYWDLSWPGYSTLLVFPGARWSSTFNTSPYGNYTLNITAYDDQNVNSTTTVILEVYPYLLTTNIIPTVQQGELHSFYYRAHEYNYEGFPNIYVNFTLWDPDGNELYMFTGNEYQANSQGEVTQNLFVLPYREFSNYTYTLYSNTSYYYSPSSMWIYNETYFQFEAKSAEDLKAKVSMPYVVYRDNSMPVTVLIYNDTGPTDPDNFSVKLYLQNDLPLTPPTYWKELIVANFSRDSEGVYTFSETISAVQPTGLYLAILNVTKEGLQTLDITDFRISAGGPYDVGVEITEPEVQPGEFLDFEISVENMGDVDHADVLIEYWISDEAQTWDFESFSANILSGENKTFLEDLYIYTSQPQGTYMLNLRVVYDPTQPAATANSTFQVVGEAPPGEEPGGGGAGGAGGAPPPLNFLKIVDFPVEISAVVGIAKFVDLKVEAYTNVSNITPYFTGIFNDWFTSDPRSISYMDKNETRIFTLRLIVPRGTKTGEYRAKVVVQANESGAKDEKIFVVLVFTSRKELIEYEIAKIKGRIKELEFKMDQVRDTKSLVAVENAIDEIWKYLNESEGFLEEERFDSALNSVYNAWEQLRIAEDLFERAPGLGFLEGIPIWLILIVIILAVLLVLLIFFLRRTAVDLKTIIGARTHEARGIAKIAKGGTERTQLRMERDKTQRVLTLIENQYKSGILTADAYNTLRSKNVQKLKEIDEKLRKTY